jgi:hypothetical protein
MAQLTVTVGDRRSCATALKLRRHRLLAAAAFGVCCGTVRPVSAITILDNADPSQYTALSAQSAYAASGYVDIVTSVSGNTTNYNFESGTLIAPDWILTAAHGVTVNESGPAYAASAITFGQGTNASFPASESVAQVFIEPGFNGSLLAGNDLALLQLSTPITNVAPARLYPSSFLGIIGDTATVVGYGYTGTGLTGYDSTTLGTRRAMQNVVDAVGGEFVQGGSSGDPTTYNLTNYSSAIAFTDFDSPDPDSAATTNILGSSTPLALEGSTAPGDSGGGLFVTAKGQTYLAGVTSFGANFSNTTPVGEYGDINGFTQVTAPSSVSFIDSELITTSSWSQGGSGTWASLNDWTGSNIPGFMQATANFGSAITTPSTVTLDANWTVGTVTFNNTNSYTLSAGNAGSLTLDNGGLAATAAVIDNGGSHFITAPITLNSNVLFNVVNGGDVLTISGPFSGNGGVTVGGSGTLRLAPGGGMTTLSALTVQTGATLDITNNSIGINYGSPGNSPVAAIEAALAHGYSAGNWTGTGINSSTAAAGTIGQVLSVGYADGNVDAGTPAAANHVLIKFTLAGDALLNGTVNFNDLDIVGQHLNTTGNDWARGNFNYDPNGVVNFNDLDIIAQNLNKTLNGSGQSLGGTTFALADSAQVTTNVAVLPEPGLGAIFMLGAAGLARRRARRRVSAR